MNNDLQAALKRVGEQVSELNPLLADATASQREAFGRLNEAIMKLAEEITPPRTGRVMHINELSGKVKYYTLDSKGAVLPTNSGHCARTAADHVRTFNAFWDEATAIEAATLRQLQYKLRCAMADSWKGDPPAWGDNLRMKYCFQVSCGDVIRTQVANAYNMIAFATHNDREQFLSQVGHAGVKLLIMGV